MTGFVGVKNMIRWLTSQGIAPTLTGMTDAIEEDFRRWPVFNKTERVASHTPFGVMELMPIADPDQRSWPQVGPKSARRAGRLALETQLNAAGFEVALNHHEHLLFCNHSVGRRPASCPVRCAPIAA